ncbi:MAG: hypothetical protein MH204_09605 [Fimbriimonadaceae bacterium]|nr:hypothetical protein [Fimbriimonadaceae bacterium]
MKLNLLPASVSKEGRSRIFLILSALVLLLSIAGAVILVLAGQQMVAQAQARADEPRDTYSRALGAANAAETVIQTALDPERGIQLHNAMAAHNTAYINLYNRVFDYVPSFMRVRSISATPAGPDAVTVNLTGVCSTFQQYSDAVMSLLRMPGVTNVVRSGYQVRDPYIPPVTEADTLATPIEPGQTNLPTDPLERLEARVNRAASEPDPLAFQNVGGFGTEDIDRGAMADASEVNFVITISGTNLQAPNPRSSILGGGGPAPAGGPGVPPGMPGGPGMPFGAPAGAGRIPPAATGGGR